MVKRHLTIIIPCKNEEGYIDKTLLSLNKQLGIDGTKVIILDANSTDNTIKIIKEIKKNEKIITNLRSCFTYRNFV